MDQTSKTWTFLCKVGFNFIIKGSDIGDEVYLTCVAPFKNSVKTVLHRNISYSHELNFSLRSPILN